MSLLALLSSYIGISQAQFTDVTSSKSFPTFSPAYVFGSGVSAADYDNDGDVDLYISSNGDSNNVLYKNLGDGNFELVESVVSIGTNSRTALWFDYNGDHLLDLLVAGDCHGASGPCPDEDYIRLFEQFQDGTFQEVTAQSGLVSGKEVEGIFGGVAAGDIDNDGYLDLVFDYWNGNVFLFKNNGDGTFEDISEEMGISKLSDYWQPLIFDISGNGWSDIYLTVDNDPNLLWKNNADGSFEEVGENLGLDNTHNDMGACFGDFDNDDDLDIYITNIERDLPGKHNALFENKSDGEQLLFDEVSKSAGVSAGGWGWGITFMDADNDMLLDLAATNGPVDMYDIDDKAKFWKNNGDLTFTDISADARFNTNLDATTLISLDYDRDGDLDMVQTLKEDQDPVAIKLLENQLNTTPSFGNYLVVKPRMNGSNHWAIGSKVSIKVGSVVQSRAITAGNSFYGQEPAEAFFGLGENTTVDEITIVWPGGAKTTITEVAGNQIITVNDSDILHAPGLLTAEDLDLDGTRLSWGHMSTNETEFIIERSHLEDFSTFDTFQVDANSNNFTDEEVLVSLTFYYRVMSSDGTNQSGYSNVVSISSNQTISGLGREADFGIYPNPTKGTFTIQAPVDFTDQLKIQLLTVSGKMVKEWVFDSSPASLNSFQMHASPTPGIYIVRMEFTDRQEILKKIAVTR